MIASTWIVTESRVNISCGGTSNVTVLMSTWTNRIWSFLFRLVIFLIVSYFVQFNECKPYYNCQHTEGWKKFLVPLHLKSRMNEAKISQPMIGPALSKLNPNCLIFILDVAWNRSADCTAHFHMEQCQLTFREGLSKLIEFSIKK